MSSLPCSKAQNQKVIFNFPELLHSQGEKHYFFHSGAFEYMGQQRLLKIVLKSLEEHDFKSVNKDTLIQ